MSNNRTSRDFRDVLEAAIRELEIKPKVPSPIAAEIWGGLNPTLYGLRPYLRGSI
jgi:hypothetical protein